jgi:WD40 repeat protein
MSTRKRTRSTATATAVEPVVNETKLDEGIPEGNGHELSEYEISRINNIRKNENFLASLGLDSVKQSIDLLKPPKKKNVSIKGVSRSGPKPNGVPVRRSGRVTTEKLKAEIEELEEDGKLEESVEKREKLEAMLAKQREGIYEVPDVVVSESYGREIRMGPISLIEDLDNKMDENDKSGESIMKLLRSLGEVNMGSASVTSNACGEPKGGKSKKKLQSTGTATSDVTVSQYASRLNALILVDSDVAKLTPSRITSVFVHPSSDKVVVMAGDKNGCLGIWDLSHFPSDNTSKVSPAAEGVYKYSPHTANISTIHCHAADSNRIHTVSYDGTIRCLDISPGRSDPTAFDLVFRHVESDEDIRHFHYTDASFHPQNKSVCLVSRSDGRVSLVDFRASASEYQNSGTVQEGVKLNSVQIHPANEFMVITAGAARGCISINDTRMLSGVRDSTKLWKPVVSLSPHSKSINAAYASPGDGRYLVSVSQDNTVKVMENYLFTAATGDAPSSRLILCSQLSCSMS